MRAAWILALALAPCLRGSDSPETGGQWTYVPAAPGQRAVESIEVPAGPSETWVSLVGEAAAAAPAPEPRRTLGVEMPELLGPAAPDAGPAASGVPEDARLPDAGGRIVEEAPVGPPSGAAAEKAANPWEIRTRKVAARPAASFRCSGVLVGGPAGPVAFVNGRIVACREVLGRFQVRRILPEGVVLGKDGALYLIPVGRDVSIEPAP